MGRSLIAFGLVAAVLAAGAVLAMTGAVPMPSWLAANAPKPEVPASAPPASKAKSADDDAAYTAFDQGRYMTALSLAKSAAGRGDPQAHTLVARIYAEGLGVAKDDVTAARWYARAAELGDVPAMVALGAMLAEGRGVEKDRAAAADLFEQAAMTGDPIANYNLGLLFLRGDGKPENPYRAAKHIEYAAEKGIAAAQYDLAALYQQGRGVPYDGLEAARWSRAAAAQGPSRRPVRVRRDAAPGRRAQGRRDEGDRLSEGRRREGRGRRPEPPRPRLSGRRRRRARSRPRPPSGASLPSPRAPDDKLDLLVDALPDTDRLKAAESRARMAGKISPALKLMIRLPRSPPLPGRARALGEPRDV